VELRRALWEKAGR